MFSRIATISVKQRPRPKEPGTAVVIVGSARRRNNKRWKTRWTLLLTKTHRKLLSLGYLAFLDCLLVEAYPALAQVFHLLPFLVSVLAPELLHRLYHSPYLDSMAVRLRLPYLDWIPTILQIQLNSSSL
jgi:hypothetical protein